jgi:hypothetical protein
MHAPYFSDAEVDEMCAGLTQDAAKIRYMKRVLGLRVDRKPNGRPLAWRPDPRTEGAGSPVEASIVVDLQGWASGRKARHGQKTQGR